MPETKQNGIAIRTYRELRGLSRDDLAKRVGKSYPYLANIENEFKDATPLLINQIAIALDIPPAAIARRPVYAEIVEATA